MWDLIVSVPDHCFSFYLTQCHCYNSMKSWISTMMARLSMMPFMQLLSLNCSILKFYICNCTPDRGQSITAARVDKHGSEVVKNGVFDCKLLF